MGRTRPPDIVHNDVAGAEKRLRKLKRSFSKVARRLDRQQFYRAVLAVVVIVLVIAVGIAAYFKFSTFELSRLNLPQILDPKVSTPNPPVTQTITGQASVIDGDTIEIHGTRIRLFGIDAPESSQTCTTGEGKEYRCGQHAALALAAKIKAQTVECQPKTNDRHGRDVAKCLVGGEDLSAWMVAQGWALAYRYFSTDYVREEERASRLKLGMWQGKFEAPWDWRRNHRGRASTPPPSSRARSAVYYRPGDLSGTRYLTMTDCEQARQRAGNVGVCVMK